HIIHTHSILSRRPSLLILGHAYPTSEAPAIGRVATLDAGLPDTVTGIQIDRRCGSGLQAVLDAAMQITVSGSPASRAATRPIARSEEHTSELQSRSDLV